MVNSTRGKKDKADEAGDKALDSTLGEIDKLEPGLGTAVGAAFADTPVGALVLATMVIGRVREDLAKLNAELDNLEKLARQPLNGGVAGLKRELDAAAVSAGTEQAALKHAGEDNDPIGTAVAQSKALMQTQLQAQRQISEVFGRTEESRLRAKGATPEEIDAAHERTQAQTDVIDHSLTLNQGSASLRAEQSRRQSSINDLETKARAASAAENAAKAKFNNQQTEIKNLRRQLGLGEQGEDDEVFKADQKAIHDAQKEFERAKADDTEHGLDDPAVRQLYEERLAHAQTDLDKASNAVPLKKRLLAQLEHSEQDRAETVADAADAAELARGERLHNAARLRQLPGEISQAQIQEAIEQHTRQVTELLNAHGGKLNESLGRLAAETGATQKQTLDMVESILAGHSTLAQRIAQLEGQVDGSRRSQGG
jgi:hypothetical protein